MSKAQQRKSIIKLLGIDQMIQEYNKPYENRSQKLRIKQKNQQQIENKKIKYQSQYSQRNNRSSLTIHKNNKNKQAQQLNTQNKKNNSMKKIFINKFQEKNDNKNIIKQRSYLYLRNKNNSVIQNKINDIKKLDLQLQNPLLSKINQKLKNFQKINNQKNLIKKYKQQKIQKSTEETIEQNVKTQNLIQQDTKQYLALDTNYYGFSFHNKIPIKPIHKMTISQFEHTKKYQTLNKSSTHMKFSQSNKTINQSSTANINRIKSKNNYQTLNMDNKKHRYTSTYQFNKNKLTSSLKSMKKILLKDRYELIKVIGRGMSGQVYQAKDILSDRFIAIKITKIESVQYEFFKQIVHENIIKYYNNFIQGNKRYLVLQYFPMTLGAILNQRTNKLNIYLTDENIKYIFKNISNGLSYLHSLSISHRDIKLQNIVISADLQQVKFIDFGLCIDIGKIQSGLSKDFCGTLSYLPPQILEGKIYDPKKADIWSLGICLYTLCLKRLPYKGKNQIQLLTKIKQTKLIFPQNFDHNLKCLIEAMLDKNPSNRLSAREILSHEWLN